MESLTVFGEPLNPWIYAILFKTVTTSTWTGLTGRKHLWAQSRILSQPKSSREKTPRLPLQKNEAARSKLKKSPTDHQQQKYHELRAKAKTLIRESREIYSSSWLGSDLAWQPKRFWSFFKLKNKTRSFPETMRWQSAGPSSINAPIERRAV